MIRAEDAAGIARELLADALPRRWAHSEGVAARARSLASVLGDRAELLEAAAWLHDIGYAPPIAHSGFHPLDGARYLRDVERANDMLCRLVAHHSGASAEAEERGLLAELETEFAMPPDELIEALVYCDMTTDPDGKPTTVEARLAEVGQRYGPDHAVMRAITRSTSNLIDMTRATARRLERFSRDEG
ncbi:HD domain-containing protein [Tenggerimyces flavus]|uniref:HD domain-containing protein n=1 Tax=Tenggerimyces flavus TaxID=1708749 RepID=A0ABV7YS62_9ACTN|nr:HD domain-containing protein [Tenggerimyces flavus]MBM7786500.1 putative hydrolase (HD superfamily) [Tenggerimyces flavus]